MANILKRTSVLDELDVVKVWSDFTAEHSDTEFTDTLTDSGTAQVGDAVNGVMTLTPSDGTVADNDECILATTNELFKFATNSQIYGRIKFRYTEVSATIANVGWGFMNAAATDPLGDNGAGAKVSGSTLAIYKVDGGDEWVCASACNGTSTVTTSNVAAAAATDYVQEIICSDWDGTSMEVAFKVDGVYLTDTNGATIKHRVAIASATEMQGFMAIKLGAITNNDTMLVDYVYFAQRRA